MQSSEHESEHQSLNWLAEIYRTYAGELQRFIYSKVGEHTLAEDLTGTVFLKAVRWLRADQSAESARAWLYATARTTIADHWQARSQYAAQPLSELEKQFAFQPESDGKASLRVQRLLSLLPERERNVLMLRYLRGYSAAQIAEALGTNAGHIRVLQLRALRRAAQVENQERYRFPMQEEQEAPFDACVRQLTVESHRVLDLACDESITLNHNFIGTEHLLWGLVKEGSLNTFFAPLDITAERIHSGIVFIFERPQMAQNFMSGQQQVPPEMPAADLEALKRLTPRTQEVIVLAGEEMKRQEMAGIRPAHLLLGLMNEGQGIGAGLLRSLSISLVQARAALMPAESNQNCSFCGRSGSQVKRIFPTQGKVGATTVSHALICDQCVELFHNLLRSV
ncbi:MAG TPA: sigma-70 family RNA polymerase sigma factor [Ktedonobacteraceae bacterium]